MQRRAWLARGGVAAALVAGALVVWGAATGFGLRQGSSSQWPDYLSLRALVSDSELVVVANYQAERTERIWIDYPNGDRAYVEQQILSLAVSDVLVGGYGQGTIEIVSDVRPRALRAPYVLFLRRFPSLDGGFEWSMTGEPYWARIATGGALMFEATDRYRDEWMEAGRTFPVEGSDAPFEATLEDVRRVVAGG